MDSGFGLFVIYILGLWLLIFAAFSLSFVKHKYVSTVSFVIFTIISIYFGYATADESKFYMPISIAGTGRIVLAIVPIICCIMSIISGILWFSHRKKIARWQGIFSILTVIFVYMGR